MKKFIASGFGVGLLWKLLFKDKKGGGTLASLLFALIIYFLNLNLLYLFSIFVAYGLSKELERDIFND